MEWIVLGDAIPSEGSEVDGAKNDLFANLLLTTCTKDVRYLLGYVTSNNRSIKDFSKIVRRLAFLLSKDVSFYLSKEYEGAFTKLTESLTTVPIL